MSWNRLGWTNFVSILVFVELALDVLEESGTFFYAVFQSLFSWNLLLMSGFFSFFFPFDTVKPPILSPPLA